jgi:putative peptidoglycan lipid II flippase
MTAAESRPGVRASRGIGTAALILMAGNLSGSVLGSIRQIVMGDVFGATSQTSAFVAASIVPQMFYDLIIGAAISAALIPTFTEIRERSGPEALWRTVGSVLGLAWIVLAALIVVLVTAAGPVMNVILWGFRVRGVEHSLALGIQMARILIPSLFFLGTSAVLLAALYSLRRFTVPAFAPGLYHLGVIAGALILAGPLGIVALPVGALLGAAAQAGVQAVALLRSHPHIRPRLDLTPEVKRILRLYLPVAIGLLVSIAGQIIDIIFKSTLRDTGAIADMLYATVLTQFPIGIAVAGLSFAVLPSISSDAAFDRMDQFKDTVAMGIRLALFLTIPAAIGYLSLSVPIVSLLYQHHHFTHHDTMQTAAALSGYAIQIPFVGLDQMLIFSFYARKDTLTPMIVGVVGVGIYVLSAVLLKPGLQVLGLALANTIQNSMHAVILLTLLFLTIGGLPGRGMRRSITVSLVAGAGMGLGAYALSAWLRASLPESGLADQALAALVPVVVGAAIYLGLAYAFRSEELRLVRSMLPGAARA